MQITKIEQQKKNPQRYNIYLDGEFALGIGEQVLVDYALYKDQTISPEVWERIKQASFNDQLYQRCLNYLSYRMRSIAEMRTYIAKQIQESQVTLDEQVSEQIIDRLTAQGYLNDQAFAEAYIRNQTLINSKGPGLIQQELHQKGVALHTIEDAMLIYSDQEQAENLAHLAEKYLRKTARLSPKIAQIKLQQHLLTKGFSNDLIQAYLQRHPIEADADEQAALLAREAEKSYTKRQRKFKGYELKQRVTQDLMRRGFDYQVINHWIQDHPDYFEVSYE